MEDLQLLQERIGDKWIRSEKTGLVVRLWVSFPLVARDVVDGKNKECFIVRKRELRIINKIIP